MYKSLSHGESLRAIAKRLGRTHTTMSRELKRHTRYGRPYKPVLADKRAARWAIKQRTKAPLKTAEILNYVHAKLRLGWSPETIAGRLPTDQSGSSTNDESIYRWIYSKKWRKDRLWRYLVCGHQKRRTKWGRRGATYTKVLDTRNINLRPKYINKRKQVGHWETDLMESSRAASAALSVTVERVTRLPKLTLVTNKTSKHKTQALIDQASGLPKSLWKSVTADRGSENKNYTVWETNIGISVFFCTAYHSWEKGTVENTIKRIRRFIPKGSNLTDYTAKQIQYIEDWLANCPMKCLQFQTPYERMQQIINKLELKT